MSTLEGKKVHKPRKQSRKQTHDAIKRIAREDDRMALRYRWAVVLRSVEGGYGTRRKKLIEKILAGEAPCPPLKEGEAVEDVVWCREHCKRAIKLSEEEMTLEHFRERPGKGNKPKPIPEELQKEFDFQINLAVVPSEAEMHRLLKRKAEALNLPVVSEWKVQQLYKAKPYVQLVAARQGTMAAKADATPGGATLARWPYHILALDELTIPVWVKFWLQAIRAYIALRLDACIVIDVFSQVILSHHVANPIRRGMIRGLDRFDVFGAACSAVFPDLAEPYATDLVGRIPLVLKYDNAKAHELTGRRFEKAGVDTPAAPGYHPWLRPEVEGLVKILKGQCYDIVGYDEKWNIAEYEADPAWKKRKIAVAHNRRLPTHIPATVEQLHSITSFRREFAARVQRVNQDLIHEDWGTTRESRFFDHIEESRCRPWTDALVLLEPKAVEVQKGAVKFRGTKFAPKVGSRMLQVGEQLVFRPDPLLRGLFVQEGPFIEFLPTKAEAAGEIDGSDLAREQNAIAGHYSRLGREAREEYQRQQLGERGAALANAVSTRRLDASDAAHQAAKRSLDEQQARVAAARAEQAEDDDTVMPVVEEPVDDAWDSEDDDADTEGDVVSEDRPMPRPGRSKEARNTTAGRQRSPASSPGREPVVAPEYGTDEEERAIAGGRPRRRGMITNAGAILRLLK